MPFYAVLNGRSQTVDEVPSMSLRIQCAHWMWQSVSPESIDITAFSMERIPTTIVRDGLGMTVLEVCLHFDVLIIIMNKKVNFNNPVKKQTVFPKVSDSLRFCSCELFHMSI